MLPPPSDLDLPVGDLIEELADRIGRRETALLGVALLTGAPRAEHADVVPFLTGHADDSGYPDYWSRVWGARTLLYVWDDDAHDPGRAVCEALGDPEWRVAEMALKVAVRRELADAVPGAERLLGHARPRVRGHACRVLGAVGEHEHLALLERATDDEEEQVRRHAARALDLLRDRLGLDPTEQIR